MFECFLSVLPHNPFVSVFSFQLFSHYIYLVSVRVLRLAIKFQCTWVICQSCKCDVVFVCEQDKPLKERDACQLMILRRLLVALMDGPLPEVSALLVSSWYLFLRDIVQEKNRVQSLLWGSLLRMH